MRQDGEYKVLLVPRHKCGVASPAPLTLHKYIQHLMKVYVDYMRPQIPCKGPCPNNLFLTKDGVAFDDWSLNRRIPEFWKRSGVRADTRVTVTNIRKLDHHHMPQKKAEGKNIDELTLRQAMCHSARAAEHLYLRKSVTHTGVEAAKIIEASTTLISHYQESPARPPENYQTLHLLFKEPQRQLVSQLPKQSLLFSLFSRKPYQQLRLQHVCLKMNLCLHFLSNQLQCQLVN